ncbi:MAG: hypothetical protein AVDCRST_MAG35-721, partial [uncultured Quadrisphaera sp.]
GPRPRGAGRWGHVADPQRPPGASGLGPGAAGPGAAGRAPVRAAASRAARVRRRADRHERDGPRPAAAVGGAGPPEPARRRAARHRERRFLLHRLARPAGHLPGAQGPRDLRPPPGRGGPERADPVHRRLPGRDPARRRDARHRAARHGPDPRRHRDRPPGLPDHRRREGQPGRGLPLPAQLAAGEV